MTESNAEARLAAMQIELPNVPRPLATFIPWKRHADVIYLAGQACVWNGDVVYRGKVGDALDLATGQEAARICALNLIAALRDALSGDLDRVTSCLKVNGYVQCTPDFPSVPQTINGASDFFHALFGPEIGSHPRTAVGVTQLPLNASVTVDAIFAVK